MIIEPYNGSQRVYHCGREYHHVEIKEFLPVVLVVIDANEATIGETNGEFIDIIWREDSLVMRKHDAGGQSQRRFERGREEALKQWLRKVRDKLLDVYDGREVIVGGPGMTKNKFVAELPASITIKDVRNAGYTDENGLWEMMNKSRYVKS